MLFLFNDVVFDLGDIKVALDNISAPLNPSQVNDLTAAQLNQLVREAIYNDPVFPRNRPDRARDLAVLISHVAPGANALLAVAAPGAEGPKDVGLRYAQITFTTLAYLLRRQDAGPLGADIVNASVWHHAA